MNGEAVSGKPVTAKRWSWARFVLPAYVVVIMIYTLVPIAVMVIYGFNQAPNQRLSFAWQGFTTEWYRHLFDVSDLTGALVTSVEVAVISSALAVALGTPAALALARRRFFGKNLMNLVIITNLTAPTVVVGASLLGFFVTIALNRGLDTIIIAHVAFNIAVVIVVVQARMASMDETLEEAAQDLGASPWMAFWKITAPLIFPAILSAYMLSFALSIDDYIITSFVNGQTLTFPLWVAGAVKVGIPPQVFVLGTLIFAVGVVVAGTALAFTLRGNRKLKQQSAAFDDWDE